MRMMEGMRMEREGRIFPLQKVVNEDDGRDEDGEGGKDIFLYRRL